MSSHEHLDDGTPDPFDDDSTSRISRERETGGMNDLAQNDSNGDVQRVLLVEDHADTTEVMSVLLRMMGLETRCVMRGREALQAAREFEPQLILVDIGLPDINGFEVVNALRSDSRFDNSCIVGVSGWSRPRDRARARSTGFDEYFVKPIDVAKVRHIVRLARGGRTILAAPSCVR